MAYDFTRSIGKNNRNVGVVFNNGEGEGQFSIKIRTGYYADRFGPYFHFLSFGGLDMLNQSAGIPERTNTNQNSG